MSTKNMGNKKQQQVQKSQTNWWKLAAQTGIIVLLTGLLVWNYMTNVMDDTNLAFTDFQLDSENLVTAVIQADRAGAQVDAVQYGLGYYDASTKDFSPYLSQYGLQGKVFRYAARIFAPGDPVPALHFLCSLFTAMTFMALVILLRRRYNTLFAGCFYVTFWLSPWVVNFARNLYWVEFTWFLPMLVGLICAIKIDSKKYRIISYVAAFVTIAIKSLCGYEYITTVMMGMLLFLGMDLVVAWVQKDKEKAKRIFGTAVIMGLLALAGFFTAILIHGAIRGDGSLLQGIQAIWEKDVMRRTLGGNAANFDAVYAESLNASIPQVLKMYFNFSTVLIAGIPGSIFPYFCLTVVIIFIWNIRAKKMEYADLAGFVIALLTSISWFALAKAHSFIHTHMNFVLWYFGFIQIGFYVILKQICNGVQLCKIVTTKKTETETQGKKKKNKVRSGK